MRVRELPDEMTPGWWIDHAPEAAGQQPFEFEPLKMSGYMPDGAEKWMSNKHTVTRRIYEEDPLFGNPHGYILLGIDNANGTADHDWRSFQCIKNQLVGAEAEAFELFPSESRLLDPSNYYMLHCFPKYQIKIGKFQGRSVLKPSESLAPQRGWK